MDSEAHFYFSDELDWPLTEDIVGMMFWGIRVCLHPPVLLAIRVSTDMSVWPAILIPAAAAAVERSSWIYLSCSKKVWGVPISLRCQVKLSAAEVYVSKLSAHWWNVCDITATPTHSLATTRKSALLSRRSVEDKKSEDLYSTTSPTTTTTTRFIKKCLNIHTH